MMTKNKLASLWVCCLVGLFLVSAIMVGCGVKRPPIAPESIPPEAITDLIYEKEGNAVTLRWSVPSKEASGSAGLGGFYIYQGETRLTGSECKDCPVLFHRIGQMGVDNLYVNDSQLNTASFAVTLVPGFQYQFKVVVFAEDGLLSPDSNRISIAHK